MKHFIKLLSNGTLLSLLLLSSLYGDLIRQPRTGVNSLHFAQNCSLGQVAIQGNDEDDFGVIENKRLSFRYREPNGQWNTEEIIFTQNAQSSDEDAVLHRVLRGTVYRWEVYTIEDSGLHQYVRSSNGSWTQGEKLISLGWDTFEDRTLIASALDKDNILHFAVLDNSAYTIKYIKFDGTSVLLNETISSFNSRTYMAAFDSPHQDYPPRNLSMALDGDGKAHVVFSTDQETESVSGGTRESSNLFYATNVSGSWVKSIVIADETGHDDAGLGASIDIAPNGVIALVSTYMPRAYTGSPGDAQLRYLTKNANGTWNSTVITDQSSGYTSGDGQQGTGLYPYLKFDGSNVPHVIFTDHASEHFGGTAYSYSGQLRYATRASATSGAWTVQTITPQPSNDAFLRRLDNPVLATSSLECGNGVAIFDIRQEFSEATFDWFFYDKFTYIKEPPALLEDPEITVQINPAVIMYLLN